MTDYRRGVLMGIPANTEYHAGLWLDKFLKNDFKGSTSESSSKEKLVAEAAGMKMPKAYESFYARWEQSLREICREKNVRKAHTLGRLAINLGSESVLETSIALHRTYGVPYIPGSALKGLAAHYVTQYLQKDPRWEKNKGDGYMTLFGTTEEAGFIYFYDALYVPHSGKDGKPLWKDVITVHHPDYYQGKKPAYSDKLQLAPPADWDSPTPIPFLTATGSFLIALSGPNNEWVEAAFKILELALEREGIGAKTNSGYGQMTFKPEQKADKAPPKGETVAPFSKTPGKVPPGYERGVVKNFNAEKNYGFIKADKDSVEMFFHGSELPKGVKTLNSKQKVIFKRGPGRNAGEFRASDVRLDE